MVVYICKPFQITLLHLRLTALPRSEIGSPRHLSACQAGYVTMTAISKC